MIIENLETLSAVVSSHKKNWQKIVWTNWCFDLVHPGHIKTFAEAKGMGDVLIVWINWDSSPYWQTKPWRPVNDQDFRAQLLDSMKYIDYVYIYQEETPLIPVSSIIPDVLVKWWDYEIKSIVGYDHVTSNWWSVVTIPLHGNYSTTSIINKILAVYK